MPIYAYRCSACGHAKDVLQKMSDPLLVTCPACSEPTFTKQVTAAGFQLKGSGWYVTDFRGGDTGKKGDADKASDDGAMAPADAAAAKPDSSKAEAAAPAAATAAPTAPPPSSAPAPVAAKPSAGPPSSST